jgi:glycerol-3-phosphate acyltransferase PlsY
MLYAGLTIAAYLLGSISNAVWVGNWLYKTDVREHGSKNAGSTNVLRVLGWKVALPVFLLDMAKGAATVCLVFLTNLHPETDSFVGFQIVLGLIAMIGHIFPVFASFKGGKGVATIAGVVAALHPSAMAMTFGVWALCLLITRYVSLSSIIAALFFPFIVIVVFGNWLNVHETITMKLFSIVIAVILLITHRKNIKRLLKREETKIVFRKRPSIDIPPRKK